MNLEEMLGVDPNDALARRAEQLVAADRKLIEDLVARRKQLNLSQDEVARRMDTSQPVVARVESGARDMHQSTLRRYAMAVEAIIEHTVLPDDRGQARSAQVLADLRSQLAETHQEDQWLKVWASGEEPAAHWSGVVESLRRTAANRKGSQADV